MPEIDTFGLMSGGGNGALAMVRVTQLEQKGFTLSKLVIASGPLHKRQRMIGVKGGMS
jgi:hypothetical protein